MITLFVIWLIDEARFKHKISVKLFSQEVSILDSMMNPEIIFIKPAWLILIYDCLFTNNKEMKFLIDSFFILVGKPIWGEEVESDSESFKIWYSHRRRFSNQTPLVCSIFSISLIVFVSSAVETYKRIIAFFRFFTVLRILKSSCHIIFSFSFGL